jgi:hypothetical protein
MGFSGRIPADIAHIAFYPHETSEHPFRCIMGSNTGRSTGGKACEYRRAATDGGIVPEPVSSPGNDTEDGDETGFESESAAGVTAKSDGGVASNAGGTISPGTVFEVLSNERRRYVIHNLKAVGERVSVRDLSEQVAAWENDTPVAEVTPKERKRVYTALHQTHLPKMAQVGVIDYDRDRGTLELTPAVAAFDIYLEIVPERELAWSEFYLALGIIATALVTLATLQLYPFTLVPDIGYAVLFAVGLLAVGGAHTYIRRRERVGDGDPTDVTASLRPPE